MPEPPKPPTVRETTKFEGPKVLIAIKSCLRDWMRGDHDVIRDTWGSYVPKNVDLKFFMGDNQPHWLLAPSSDEVIMHCPDKYLDLAHKTKAIAAYAYDKGYDFVFLCDNDTFVHPEKLLTSGFQNFDYSGHFWTYDGKNKYFHGGYGYWFSRRSMYDVSIAEVGDSKHEDAWVGDVIRKGPNMLSIRHGTLPKFSWHFPKDHYPSAKYHPSFPWQEMMTTYHLRGEQPADREWDAPVGNQTRRVKWNLIPRTCK